MAVHQCPRCELRFRSEGEVTDHLRTEHRVDPVEREPLRYGSERQQKPIYPDLREVDEDEVHRVLVIGAKTLRSERLQRHLSKQAAGRPTEFLLVVPASADETAEQAAAIEASFATVGRVAHAPDESPEGDVLAHFRLREVLGRLQGQGLTVEGVIGNSDPMEAAAGALSRFAADEVVLSTLPQDRSRWLDIDLPTELRRRFSVPVTVVTAA